MYHSGLIPRRGMPPRVGDARAEIATEKGSVTEDTVRAGTSGVSAEGSVTRITVDDASQSTSSSPIPQSTPSLPAHRPIRPVRPIAHREMKLEYTPNLILDDGGPADDPLDLVEGLG